MAMEADDLQTIAARGEDSRTQFKVDVHNVDAIAAEMAAFSNCEGGRLLIGVTDAGELSGIARTEIGRINQLVSNAASQHVRSPVSPMTENVSVGEGRVVIVVTIPTGIDKPYFDRNGVIWLKSGSDKRRVNSKEELRRLFQMSSQFHADGLPAAADLERLDVLRFRDFLRDVYDRELPESPEQLLKLLQNMNLAVDDGRLNLAGVLLFAERPEWIAPQFVVKAVCYPGNEIHVTDYLDSEDFAGPLDRVFADSLAFVLRNLHKVQAGRGVNAPGLPEIPPLVFEELLVNALVHRDYLVSAPIRLFVFGDRIEIVSPGHLPNSLTVDRILHGNSNIRNPILVSYVAKGVLPYRGLGSGIRRALDAWPAIGFADDRDGCIFTATVHREAAGSAAEAGSSPRGSEKSSEKSSEKTADLHRGSEKSSEKTADVRRGPEKILAILRENQSLSAREIADEMGISQRAVEKQIASLRAAGRLRRVGPARGGHWEVIVP